jgi:hypothetical protein
MDLPVTCPRGHACFLWTCTEDRGCDMHDDPAFTAGCRRILTAGDQGLKCIGCDYDFCLPCSIAMRGTAFEHRDYFSGRTWRVPSAELLAQVDAAFRLINAAAAHLRLPRGHPLALELPPSTSCYPRVSLLPSQLQRAAIGFAAAASHGLATAPASMDVSARTTWQWRTRILLRVMGGYIAKNQVHKRRTFAKALRARVIIFLFGLTSAAGNGGRLQGAMRIAFAMAAIVDCAISRHNAVCFPFTIC